ncbi:hypothetical protein Tco_0389407 [Tanacetum coccineum]
MMSYQRDREVPSLMMLVQDTLVSKSLDVLVSGGVPYVRRYQEGQSSSIVKGKGPDVLVTCRSCQVECLEEETEIVPLSYHLGHDIQIQFSREEFCLVTGLGFGVDYSAEYKKEGPIPFRRHVFTSAKDGKPIRGSMLVAKINSDSFYRINDHDAVSFCCIAILQLVLLDLEDKRKVPDWILRCWQPLYAEELEEARDHNSYSLMGFTWVFKGRRPTPTLTSDDFEARSNWWVSSMGYYDGHIREPA